MKIDLIKFNFNKIIVDLSLKLIYINLLLILINTNILNREFVLFKWTLLLFSIILIIFKVILKVSYTYKVIGFCHFGSTQIEIVKYERKIIYEHAKINSIDFKYGGYNGEEHVFEVFRNASWSKDGTRNFIYIDQTAYQIYLDKKTDLLFIQNYLNEMRMKGVKKNFY